MVERTSGRKVISPENKQQAIRELVNGATLASVSNKYGVSVAALSTWKRGANSAPVPDTQPSEPSTQDADELTFLKLENQYLKAKVARLEAGTQA